MTRWALMSGATVAQVIEQDGVPQIPGEWVQCGNAGPGWKRDGVTFKPPAGPSWSDADLDPRYWWLDIGRFNARLGPDAAAIAASAHGACRASVSILGMSKYADLKDAQLSQMLDMLIATAQPEVNPMFPGSGPMTAAKKAAVLAPPTTEYERHIKGLVQPQ